MPILGGGNVPLVYLFLRGFKRVIDHGETLLVGGSIKKTLSKLDFCSMQKIITLSPLLVFPLYSSLNHSVTAMLSMNPT